MLVCIVDFVIKARDVDAGSVDEGVADGASACVVLREIGLVGRASLADVLDD